MPVFNNTNPLKILPTTAFKVYVKTTTYAKGQGNSTTWSELDSDGYKVFYCEWRTMYGDRALTAESMGVREAATVRTFYNPNIYNAITRNAALIVRNADAGAIVEGVPDKSSPNLFEAWGGVDNVLEERRFMEFRVRRYEWQ